MTNSQPTMNSDATEPSAPGTGLSTCCFAKIVLVKQGRVYDYWKCSKCGKTWRTEVD